MLHSQTWSIVPDPLAALPISAVRFEPCLLLEQDGDGLRSSLLCSRRREDALTTLAYLRTHYPDGLARLRPLVAVEGTPGQ